MGSYFSLQRKKKSFVMIGLPGGGKKTFLHRIPENKRDFIWNILRCDYDSTTTIFSWDLTLQFTMFWRYFFEDCLGLMMVIDAGDSEQLTLLDEVLTTVLTATSLHNKPVVFILNKQDRPNVNNERIKHLLEQQMKEQKDRKWITILSTAIESGDCFDEAIDWLVINSSEQFQ